MPLFTLELLFDPTLGALKADRRMHAGATVSEAARGATEIVSRVSLPGTIGFRLLDGAGKEVHRWYKEGPGGLTVGGATGAIPGKPLK